MKKGVLEVLRVQSWVCAVRGFLLWNMEYTKVQIWHYQQHLWSIHSLRSSTNCRFLYSKIRFLPPVFTLTSATLGLVLVFQVFCCCFGGLWWMRAERSIRQITDAGIIIYGPPAEVFSASENSSQVRNSSSTLGRESPGASISCCTSTVWPCWFKMVTLKSALPSKPKAASCSQLRPLGSVCRSCSLLRYEFGLMVTNKEVLWRCWPLRRGRGERK